MRIRFPADADLNPRIARGLRRREPTIDFRDAAEVIPGRTDDSDVLRIAAEDGRVLVTTDVTTMPVHFERFIGHSESPGLLLIPSGKSIAFVIDGPLLAWLTWDDEDLRNQIRWLPHP